jgi:hypothetical protein
MMFPEQYELFPEDDRVENRQRFTFTERAKMKHGIGTKHFPRPDTAPRWVAWLKQGSDEIPETLDTVREWDSEGWIFYGHTELEAITALAKANNIQFHSNVVDAVFS